LINDPPTMRCLTPRSYSCSLHHATPRPNLLIYISFCPHVLFKNDGPLPRSCVARVDRLNRSASLVLFQLKKVPLLPTASFPGPFTRELLTHWQATSDLSGRRAAVPRGTATDACHRTWRRCHSPPTHSCTMRVSKTSTIHRSFVSGYRALDFSDVE